MARHNYWTRWDPVLLNEKRRGFSIFRSVVGIVLAVVGFAIISGLTIAPVAYFESFEIAAQLEDLPEDPDALEATLTDGIMERILSPSSGDYLGLVIFVSIFLSCFIPVVILASIHDRHPMFSFTIGGPWVWSHVAKAAWAWGTVMILLMAIGYAFEPGQYRTADTWNLLPANYGYWLLAASLVIGLQTLGEELLFRGYLVRAVGGIWPWRPAAVLIPMIIFMALHQGNEDVAPDPVFAGLYFMISGVLYYVLLFRTGSIAACWGVHFANNMFVFLVMMSEPGMDNNSALFTYTDPILSAGGSNLTNVWAWGAVFGSQAAMFVALLWHRSPFYIAPLEPRLHRQAAAELDAVARGQRVDRANDVTRVETSGSVPHIGPGLAPA